MQGMHFCTGTKLVSTFVKLFTQGLDVLKKFHQTISGKRLLFSTLFGHVWNNRLDLGLEVDFVAPLSRSYCVLKLIF